MFRLRGISAAVALLCAFGVSGDTVLTTSTALSPAGSMYFSEEGKGTVSYNSSNGWYTYTPSALDDDTTVTLTVEITNVTYRAYNKFWVEWDNLLRLEP